MNDAQRERAIEILNEGMEHEISALLRYLHHAFLVFGPGRDPIVSLLKRRAEDCFEHATQLGEKITALGGHPTTEFQPVRDTKGHSVEEMLQSDLEGERAALALYADGLEEVSHDIVLEDMFRTFVLEECGHVEELEKLLRTS